jgi:predicted SnoaL-like aldol condensation-catalyzing enzyme
MSPTKSNTDRIREYFRRQYELEEGSAEENINALFAEDVVYHLGEGRTVSREALARSAAVIRQTPKSERITEISDLNEQGDVVTLHMHVRFRNPETGQLDEMESDHVWRFNAESKVVEVKMNQGDEAARIFRLN